MDTTLNYKTIQTDSGYWNHAPGSDFMFAFIDSSWDQPTKDAVTNQFKTALSMSSKIKQAVLNTSGQQVVNGLYTLNQQAMTTAMNSISGMGLTGADQQSQSGNGTATTINQEFFQAVLGGLSGDVTPMMDYLNSQMQGIQVQTGKSTITENFGTVIGLVSLMPILNVPVTSFQYTFSTEATSSWFVKVNCGSTESYSYNYSYTVANYNYDTQ